MQPIVTLTMNPAVDKSAGVDRVVPERKLRCGPLMVEPGGGGINVSRAIHKLGGDSLALYPAGGTNGEVMHHMLEQEGIRHQGIPIRNDLRESFTVYEETTELQYRFNMPGPEVGEAEWQHCLEQLRGAAERSGYIVASGSLPPGVPEQFYAQVARIGNELGARVIVDTSGPALCSAVYDAEGVFLIKPNINELSALAGRELKDEADQERVAQEIIARGQCEVIVVSLGAAGVLYVTRDGCERLRAPTVPIKSKVGAGDSTVGGMTLALARGLPLRNAVRFGIAAGAAAVMTPGSELCRRDDTERLYERIRG